MAIDKVKQRIAADGIQYLLAQFVDIHGSAKVKMVPARCLEDIVAGGAGFAGAAVWGMGQGPHSHDLMGRADLHTYTPLPWEPGVARFACDIYVDGKPHPYCPRVNLKRVLHALREAGYTFNVGIEPEFFLVERRPDGRIAVVNEENDCLEKPCYDYKGISHVLDFLKEMNDCLERLGWEQYQTDHEDANGQFEINFRYADALTSADRYTFFKMLTSQLSKKHGFIATHMAKPFSNLTGSGAHFHYHLADAETGENKFVDDKDPRGLGQSELAYHFVGGILKHARALTAITSPTVNCYKRLQVGPALYGTRSGHTWTPAFVTYGDNNRTQMLRCPGPGRFEDRTISAAANMYLALAAYITAGLDGIRNQIDPGAPNTGNMYDRSLEELLGQGIKILPQSLPESLAEMRNDPVLEEALGPIYGEYLRLKEGEWRQYHRTVSQWEIDRYLQLF